jgi:type I site-specific restriction-modification system R (restriction) subunit
MSDQTGAESDLVAEFRQFTENLKTAIQTAWESPGRQQLQADLQEGLEDMRQTFNQMASDFAESDTGQQLKSDLSELGERVRSGELEDKVRSDLVQLLKRVNQELESASDKLSQASTTDADAGESSGAGSS